MPGKTPSRGLRRPCRGGRGGGGGARERNRGDSNQRNRDAKERPPRQPPGAERRRAARGGERQGEAQRTSRHFYAQRSASLIFSVTHRKASHGGRICDQHLLAKGVGSNMHFVRTVARQRQSPCWSMPEKKRTTKALPAECGPFFRATPSKVTHSSN